MASPPRARPGSLRPRPTPALRPPAPPAQAVPRAPGRPRSQTSPSRTAFLPQVRLGSLRPRPTPTLHPPDRPTQGVPRAPGQAPRPGQRLERPRSRCSPSVAACPPQARPGVLRPRPATDPRPAARPAQSVSRAPEQAPPPRPRLGRPRYRIPLSRAAVLPQVRPGSLRPRPTADPRPAARPDQALLRAPGQQPRLGQPPGRPRSRIPPSVAACPPWARPGSLRPRPTPALRPPARPAQVVPRAPEQAPPRRPRLGRPRSRIPPSVAACPPRVPPPLSLPKRAPRPAVRPANQSDRPHRRPQLPSPCPGGQARAQLPRAEPLLHLQRLRNLELPLAAMQPHQIARLGLVFRPVRAA